LALVKNQIWSPDLINRSGGFQPFHSSGLSEVTPQREEESSVKTESSVFQILPESVEKLLNEPSVHARMEQLIQERVSNALGKILKSFNWAEEKVGSLNLENLGAQECALKIEEIERSLEKEWKKKFEDLEEQRQKMECVLEAAITDWKSKRDSLLIVHEKEWRQTLIYLLERFQRKAPSFSEEALDSWLKMVVEDFSSENPVSIYLASEDFQRVQNGNRPTKAQWTFFEDKNLKAGQVRVEANNAGIIFDPDKNLQKLCDLVGVA